LGLDNGVGLSSLLTDASLDVAATVQTAQSGLDLLSAGPMPPDPTRLLSSKRCAVVVEQIRQLPGYDLVLFDTPPALPLGDPVLLAEHLDGLLFVVGLGRVNRELPMQAFERVRSTGVDVLGMVGNQPYRRVRSRSGYGYGYGYGSRRYGEHYGGYEHMASHYDTASENGNDAAKPTPALARRGVRKFMRWINHSD
jgi:polysaccharide biosynthesis transport protein